MITRGNMLTADEKRQHRGSTMMRGNTMTADKKGQQREEISIKLKIN